MHGDSYPDNATHHARRASRLQSFLRSRIVQAHADAMGTWGDIPGGQRSSWEGNPRLDLRAVRDCRGLLPCHEALNHNMWSVSQLLHPGIAILTAIDDAGATQEGTRILPALSTLIFAYLHAVI